MTQAEKIVRSGEIPKEWNDAAEEVRSTCKAGFEMLHTGKNTDGVEIEPEALAHLEHTHEHHGLHAYRYEVCSDGSVVALWANTKTANLKLMAFPDLETASRWTPRNER